MEHTPQASDFTPPAPVEQPWERPDPQWYKDAVFYEVLVRAFYDPDGTGSGTLKGLEEKLDYLQWLGVDCLWLPPFYDSPLRDGGYDIRDFRKVLPEFGTVEDFISLIDAAHKRGIRIITDFPINHTSDQHPWFIQSREDPEGPYGDYYVWTDDDKQYDGTRIIFIDTETSNWTWDPVRKQFFWHRFFSHQPDLNYDNPKVQEEVLDVIRFWLDLGMDGIRLDAIPYLFEREGTNSENLPETHGFIKRVRKLFDEEYPGRFLLAEANQMPHEVVEYFGEGTDGTGDECQMAFHFPVMPRIFMGLHKETAQPIIDILRETPDIPETAQWGIFLRNHDELTLEMVTEEERDYMYKSYAFDPRMRANVGIRRRLAPLLGGHRDRLELAHALLLSLPGSPFLYYGDEIGMGDNIWLPDRDGVRTPMQWSNDRNGGFSKADPERLYLPPVRNDQYGFHIVNVESQVNQDNSLLHWVRTLVHIRKQYKAFGRGSYIEVEHGNEQVLAFIREYTDDNGRTERILCVHNMSSRPQPVMMQLAHFAGITPRELSGGVEFPTIGELPWLTTLAPHGFFWFDIS
ncbi:maltose alpha-D-glucosyltransferase [Corynebacterium sp. CNCTC7651]|uniref:maltose alpha-D-glucosyltransferase n=1 Tax=Corynebacterium sp. CNCTC7651 TaxID=2815361 RepID=UPI001F1DBE80|nr:maltose alpha-D-glucosyltransferase [Corynebacterium sp. CNCTC7651]UIZ91715.1 maltose alpha-D-glucosyltransferase [Corynebacterium sp. CNCTC7651]